MIPDDVHAFVLAEVDALLEAPIEARELRDELAELQMKHRDARATERPGCEEGGCR